MDASRHGTLLPLTAVALLSLIWGYNWVVMKVAIADCGPLLFAALRVWLSVLAIFVALVLLSWQHLRPVDREPLPTPQE